MKYLLILFFYSLSALGSENFNPYKEGLKKAQDPYDPKLDITCEQLLKIKNDIKTSIDTYIDFKKKNPNSKKELRNMTKLIDDLQAKDNEFHASYMAKAIQFERLSGKTAISYDQNQQGIWSAERVCRMYGEKVKDYPLSQILLNRSPSKTATELTIMHKTISDLTEALKHCEENKRPDVDKSSRKIKKEILDKLNKLKSDEKSQTVRDQ